MAVYLKHYKIIIKTVKSNGKWECAYYKSFGAEDNHQTEELGEALIALFRERHPDIRVYEATLTDSSNRLIHKWEKTSKLIDTYMENRWCEVI